jgi:Protein of unknown function (DUF3768)
MADVMKTAKQIREFNDQFRRDMPHGSVRISWEVGQLFSNEELRSITQLIQAYEAFGLNEDNDELHDAGMVEYEGVKLIWQIEGWDAHTDRASTDPLAEAATRRLLRIALVNDG